MGINRLMTVIMQSQDVDHAIEELSKAGLVSTLLSSTGVFLGSRNTTLLIGISAGQEAEAVRILGETCRRRVEYWQRRLKAPPFTSR